MDEQLFASVNKARASLAGAGFASTITKAETGDPVACVTDLNQQLRAAREHVESLRDEARALGVRIESDFVGMRSELFECGAGRAVALATVPVLSRRGAVLFGGGAA